jgi:hypothetical protein
VALPDRRMLARQQVDRGQPAAHPDPSGDGPVEAAAWIGGAGERPAQARVGAAAPAGPSYRAGCAPRRPCDPRPAHLRAHQGASRAAGRVATGALAFHHSARLVARGQKEDVMSFFRPQPEKRPMRAPQPPGEQAGRLEAEQHCGYAATHGLLTGLTRSRGGELGMPPGARAVVPLGG